MIQVIVKNEETQYKMYFETGAEARKFANDIEDEYTVLCPYLAAEKQLRKHLTRIMESEDGVSGKRFIELTESIIKDKSITREFHILTGKVWGMIALTHTFPSPNVLGELSNVLSEFKSFVENEPLYV